MLFQCESIKIDWLNREKINQENLTKVKFLEGGGVIKIYRWRNYKNQSKRIFRVILNWEFYKEEQDEIEKNLKLAKGINENESKKLKIKLNSKNPLNE